MIKTIYDKEKWNSVIMDMDEYDFYHTYEYHEVLKNNNEESILLVYEEEQGKIAIPFLKRCINGGNFYDFTSVHGYLGPLSNGTELDYNQFRSEFTSYLKDLNVVSVFVKLNPFIDKQENIINSLGDIEEVGEVVYIDQLIDNDTQFSQYSPTTRTRIRKLRKICSVKEVEDDHELQGFINYYHINLDRLKAEERFYFKKEYFEKMLNSKMLSCKMLIAVHNETGDVMGGGLGVGTKNIAQLELAWTNETYYKFSPVRILYDEFRQLLKNDIKYLNLGGGKGGRDGSLMQFKSTFSQKYKYLKVWKFIVLPEIYHQLQSTQQKASESNFFPKYRIS